LKPSLVFLVILAAGGCQARMMRTPVAFESSGADPFKDVPEAERTGDVGVFYATDRALSGKSAPADYFSDDSSPVVRLGQAQVRFGQAGMTWERFCELSRQDRRGEPIAKSLAHLEDYGVLWTTIPPPGMNPDPDDQPDPSPQPAQEFKDAVNQMLAASRQKEITIFVHGFDTAMDSNIELVGELWHYAGREGVFMEYDWPSEDRLLGYVADKGNAAYSTRPFRLLLEFLAQETAAEHINIFAHSAGSPIVVQALTDLRLKHAADDLATMRAKTRIGLVVLAAPDMDLGLFLDCCQDGWQQTPRHVNVYMSSTDRALGLASRLFEAPRVGQTIDHMSEALRRTLRATDAQISVIDVTSAQREHGTWLGHSYYQDDPWVSSDLILTLRFGLPPEQRGLVRASTSGLWTFPNDYPQRVQITARQLYGAE
jgi:hypothetical protein